MKTVLDARASRRGGRGRRWSMLLLGWAVVATAAAVIAVAGTGSSPAHAAPGDPFDPADAFVFVAQNQPTQLFKAIPDAEGNVVFQAEGAARVFTYNALAYHPVNNYLYAIKTSAADTNPWPQGSLIRIGQQGVPIRVGTGTLNTAVVGAMGGDNFFYSFAGTTVQRTNPNTGVVTNNYTLPSSPAISDFTYADGFFWSIDSSGAGVRIDVTSAPPRVDYFPGVSGAGAFGAAWTYGNGNIGLSHNTTGQVYQYAIENPASATPTFTLVSSVPGPASGNNDGAASPGQPTDLTIAKSVPARFAPGGTITYTLTVTNNGPGNASGFTVSDTVPAPFTNVQTTTPGCTVAGNTVTCTANRTLAGASRVVTITASSPASAPVCVTNTATVTANESDTNTANNTASAQTCAEPGLTVTKTAGTSLVASPGAVIPYTFTVTNIGGYEIDDVVVTDPLIPTITCVPTTLPAGAVATCTGSYTVDQDDIDAGRIDNVATVTGDGPDGPLPPTPSNTVTVPVAENPQLQITKFPDSMMIPPVGSTINYLFGVSNVGNQTITGIAVDDPLIPSVTCVTTTLAPGASTTCSGSYTVTQDDINAGSLTNQATVTGVAPGGVPLPPTPSNQVTLNAVQRPELTVVKASSDTDLPSVVGTPVSYRVTVTNTGNVTISDIVVDDPQLAALVCSDDALDPGEWMDCIGDHLVTSEDIEDGEIRNTATATGTTPGGGTLPPTPSNEVVVPVAQNPELTVVKATNLIGAANRGDWIEYVFIITNTGNVTVETFELTDDNVIELLCASNGPIAPGGYVTCSAAHQVDQADLDAGEVLNTATVTGTWSGGAVPPAESNEVRVPVFQVAGMTITKSATPASVAAIGAPITYTFVVTNTGNVTLTDLVITDPIVGPVDCPTTTVFPSAAPEFQVTCTATRPATAADFDNGVVVNTATATAQPPGDLPALPPTPSNTVTITADQRPELTITKSADVAQVAAVGDTIEYTIEITNTGNVTVDDIVVSDPKVVSVDCSGVTSLAANTSMECTATYSVTAEDLDAGHVTNVASVSGTSPEGPVPPVFSDEVVVDVDQQPALNIEKFVDAPVVSAPGTELEYWFEVTNTGNVTVSGISIVDPLVGTVSCPVTVLASGESMTCTATYVVTPADLDAGSIVNVAAVSGNGPEGPATSVPSDPVTVDVDQQPGLSIVKGTVTTVVSSAGQAVPYTFVVTNTGNVTLSDVVVVDPRVSGVTCPAAVLASGESMTCAATYVVTQADVDSGSLANTATVTGTPPAGSPLPPVPSNTVTVGVDQQPGLTIVKTTPTTPTAAGETVRFEFLVTNTGNVTVGGIAVDDPMVPAVTCPAATLAPGASMTCVGDYTVTAADVAAGQIVNTATVVGVLPGGASLPAVSSNQLVVPFVVTPPTPPPPGSTTPAPAPGELPATGGDSMQLLRIVALLLAAGGVLFVIGRRRATSGRAR